MSRPQIVYIGNALANSTKATATVMDTLSLNLEREGYTVVSASAKKNKLLRLSEMLHTVWKHARASRVVLIDTYGTQNFYYAVATAKLCRLLKRPYIPILHGGSLPQRLENSGRLAAKVFNHSETNVAPSHYFMDVFKRRGYQNLTYIPNSVELRDYTFRARSSTRPRLLWVRAFSETYNPKLALEVLERLLVRRPDATLCMVGPDKDGTMKECQAIAEAKRLPVTFTGKLSKEAWRERAAECDVFVNTTNIDNTPVSVIEAMALGLPVVSTDVGGIPYLIEDGTDALLVPAGDSASFVDRVERLCRDPELASRLASNARNKVEKFDWEEVKHLWFELLGR